MVRQGEERRERAPDEDQVTKLLKELRRGGRRADFVGNAWHPLTVGLVAGYAVNWIGGSRDPGLLLVVLAVVYVLGLNKRVQRYLVGNSWHQLAGALVAGYAARYVDSDGRLVEIAGILAVIYVLGVVNVVRMEWQDRRKGE